MDANAGKRNGVQETLGVPQRKYKTLSKKTKKIKRFYWCKTVSRAERKPSLKTTVLSVFCRNAHNFLIIKDILLKMVFVFFNTNTS